MIGLWVKDIGNVVVLAVFYVSYKVLHRKCVQKHTYLEKVHTYLNVSPSLCSLNWD